MPSIASNTTGSDNTANGLNALYGNTTGSRNIAIGKQAGVNLTTESNNIDIGNVGVAGDAAKIRIGQQGTQTATYVTGIYGKTVASGTKVGVMINSTGKLAPWFPRPASKKRSNRWTKPAKRSSPSNR
jgi:hypothetical protein